MARKRELCEHGNVGKTYCHQCQAKWRRGKYARLSPAKKKKNHAKVYAWRRKNPAGYKMHTHRSRCKQYGLTPEQYADLLVTQDGRCAICKTAIPGGHGTWHIDHDHSSGAVRGLLCNACNAMLGYAKDNTLTLSTAVKYLASPPAIEAVPILRVVEK